MLVYWQEGRVNRFSRTASLNLKAWGIFDEFNLRGEHKALSKRKEMKRWRNLLNNGDGDFSSDLQLSIRGDSGFFKLSIDGR
ncbi:unnamed protein product [Linum trigynum]|uniref:Uncharacterized protein n=1 Tax=Linum trigynum TaxID=586398 RepID=A0AAV2CPW4_9ROSI